MKTSFCTFKPDENIPVFDYVKNRKLAKYYNRETSAALVALGKIVNDHKISENTPVFYATGLIEYEELGLQKIAEGSKDENKLFSTRCFIEYGLPTISPLTQFKVLYNMTVCFISIEHGLKGENASVYSSAQGLILNSKYYKNNDEQIIGAGKVYSDGTVESGFAIITKSEIKNLNLYNSDTEAIEIFRNFHLT